MRAERAMSTACLGGAVFRSIDQRDEVCRETVAWIH